MNVIYPHRRPNVRKASWKRRAILWGALGLGAVAIINVALLGIYNNRAYPRTSMGTMKVGNQTFSQINKKAASEKLTGKQVILAAGNKTAIIKTSDINLSLDTARTVASLDKTHTWFPIVAVFTKHTVALPAKADQDALNIAADKIAPVFHIPATESAVSFKDGKFSTSASKPGQDLDQQKLLGVILDALDKGKANANAPLIATKPKTSQTDAEKTASKLQSSLDTSITIKAGSGSQKLSSSDIASWYVFTGTEFGFDDLAIRTSIFKAGLAMGTRASNLAEAAVQAKQAVTTGVATTVALAPWGATKTYTYCADAKGVSSALLSELKERMSAAYTDLRGWNIDGQIIYKYAETGCDFTVWLAAPDQMTSFGAICDAYWNCNVGQNVIINLDRWNNTSDAWKAYGGSLGDYRIMSINHETGHMLGFGHLSCPGAGQPAPVMMQQSIDMQGCVFNIWPTQNEANVLRRYLGI